MFSSPRGGGVVLDRERTDELLRPVTRGQRGVTRLYTKLESEEPQRKQILNVIRRRPCDVYGSQSRERERDRETRERHERVVATLLRIMGMETREADTLSSHKCEVRSTLMCGTYGTESAGARIMARIAVLRRSRAVSNRASPEDRTVLAKFGYLEDA